MIHLVLVESPLELIPLSIATHPIIQTISKKRGKKPTEMLLDVSLHYRVMRSIPKMHKRGRPDIVHRFLIEALGSPLNKMELLKIYVHTINDDVIEMRSDLRIPRNYNRFVGLMEQLLIDGTVPRDEPLMWIFKGSLRKLIERINPETVVLMHESGDHMNVLELADKIVKLNNPVILIGGFPHGDFEKETMDLANLKVSIYDKPLETSIVASRVLCGLELKIASGLKLGKK
ncbi:MAG: 16S rRNA methyltransferase [Thermoprotei archaeon]|jgi:rRNA small subunit pseudouridine methyltransferase Nep1